MRVEDRYEKDKPAAALGKNNKGARLTQAQRIALSDSRMLDAALELIREVGTHDITLAEVGIRAGYSRGLASSRFGSREGLFFELLKKYNQAWRHKSREAVGGHTGLTALKCANRALIDFYQQETDFVRGMYLVWYDMVGYSSDMRAELSKQHALYRRSIAQWLREAINIGDVRADISPQQVASQYGAGVFGLMYQWLVNEDSIDLGRSLAELYEITIASIVPPGQHG